MYTYKRWYNKIVCLLVPLVVSVTTLAMRPSATTILPASCYGDFLHSTPSASASTSSVISHSFPSTSTSSAISALSSASSVSASYGKDAKTATATKLQQAVRERNWPLVKSLYTLPVYTNNQARNLILILRDPSSPILSIHDSDVTMLALALHDKAAPIIVAGPVFRTYLSAHNNKQAIAVVEAVKKQKTTWDDMDLLRMAEKIDAKQVHSLFPLAIHTLIPCSSDDWHGYYNKTGDLVLLIPKKYMVHTYNHAAAAHTCGFNEKNLELLSFTNPQAVTSCTKETAIVDGLTSMFIPTKSAQTASQSETKGEEPAAWNIYWTGHGLPTTIINGLFAEKTAMIAGLHQPAFKNILSFLQTKLNVTFVYGVSCFSGGRNKEVITNILREVKPHFNVIFNGTSDMTMYIRDLESFVITGDRIGVTSMRFPDSFDCFFTMLNAYFLQPELFVHIAHDFGYGTIDPLIAALIGLLDLNEALPWNFLPIIHGQHHNSFAMLPLNNMAILTDSKLIAHQLCSKPFDASNKAALVIHQPEITLPLILGPNTLLLSRLPITKIAQNMHNAKSTAFKAACTTNSIVQIYQAKHHLSSVTSVHNPLWHVILNLTRYNVAPHTTFIIDNLYCQNYSKSGIQTTKPDAEMLVRQVVVEIYNTTPTQIYAIDENGNQVYPGTVVVTLKVGQQTYRGEWQRKDLHAEAEGAEGLFFKVVS